MRAIYSITFLILMQSFGKISAAGYPPRQLLKFTLFPEYYSYRLQYECAPKKIYSFGGSIFYSPNGSWGNYKGSKWFGISPVIRAYASSSRSKGLYLEASVPITYKENYPLNYGLQSISPSIIGNNIYSYKYKANINQSFTAAGGGLALGGQFKLYRRIFMDISMVYEKYIRPKSVNKEIVIRENVNGNTAEEKYKLDEPFNNFSMRIYLAYQLNRD